MSAFWWGFLGFFAGWFALVFIIVILGAVARAHTVAETDRCNWNDELEDAL
jgi:hypothetical protein